MQPGDIVELNINCRDVSKTADGPGEGPMDESERKTQEAIGAFMAERGEYEREFSSGLTENVGTTNEF